MEKSTEVKQTWKTQSSPLREAKKTVKVVAEKKISFKHTSETDGKSKTTELLQLKTTLNGQAVASSLNKDSKRLKHSTEISATLGSAARATGINATAQGLNVQTEFAATKKTTVMATGINANAQGANIQTEVKVSQNETAQATIVNALAQGINVQTEAKATVNSVARATGANLNMQGANVQTEAKATSNRSAMATGVNALAQGVSVQTEAAATMNHSAMVTGLSATAKGVVVETVAKVSKNKKIAATGFEANVVGLDVKNSARTHDDTNIHVQGGTTRVTGARVENHFVKETGNSFEASALNADVSGVKVGHSHVQESGLGLRLSACNVQASLADLSTSSGSSTKLSMTLVNVGVNGMPTKPSAGGGLGMSLFNFGNRFGGCGFSGSGVGNDGEGSGSGVGNDGEGSGSGETNRRKSEAQVPPGDGRNDLGSSATGEQGGQLIGGTRSSTNATNQVNGDSSLHALGSHTNQGTSGLLTESNNNAYVPTTGEYRFLSQESNSGCSISGYSSNGPQVCSSSCDHPIVSNPQTVVLDHTDGLFEPTPEAATSVASISPFSSSVVADFNSNLLATSTHPTSVDNLSFSYESYLYENLARELGNTIPNDRQSSSQRVASAHDRNSLLRLCKERYAAKLKVDQQLAKSDQQSSVTSSVEHRKLGSTEDKKDNMSSEDAEEEAQKQEEPWGANKNIHGLKTLGKMSSSKKIQKFGSNIRGFKD